jgi:hypothetical protein
MSKFVRACVCGVWQGSGDDDAVVQVLDLLAMKVSASIRARK